MPDNALLQQPSRPSVRQRVNQLLDFDQPSLARDTLLGFTGGPASTNAIGAARIGRAAVQAAPEVGQGIRAYHGSPHDFDRFDMSKLGTGEGAQVYGHGLYFAENENVARAYRDALTAPNAQGRVYEVNLQTSPNRLLDWDTPIGMQPHVVEALGLPPMTASVSPQEVMAAMKAAREAGVPASHFPAYRALQERQALAKATQWDSLGIGGRAEGRAPGDLRGSEYYGGLTEHLGDQALATQRLRDRGLDGIRFLDAGSRFDGAAGTSRNIVTFDDSIVDIIRKYGIAGLMAGGATAAGMQGEY